MKIKCPRNAIFLFFKLKKLRTFFRNRNLFFNINLPKTFFLSFFWKYLTWIFYYSYASICKDLQKTTVLLSGPFMQIFTFSIQCICNLWWFESSRDHPMIRCHKYIQQTDRGPSHTEAWFQQSCCYASLLKSHFGTSSPALCRPAAYSLKHSETGTPQRVASDAFATHSSLIWEITCMLYDKSQYQFSKIL